MQVAGNERSIEAVRELLRRDQVHTVECMFADTWGIPRGKRLSAAHFCSTADGHGFAIANVAFTWDMHGVIFPTRWANDVTGYPDMHVVPDVSTLRLAGWKDGTAFCFCDTVDPESEEPIPLDGRDAFNVEDDDPPLHSKVMRRYLSGLLAHQVDLQAVNCPTINAYKRVEDYSFAPTQVSWGLDNRLVGVRSAVGRGSATRLECRWASGDANPYLVVAGCLAAGTDGLEHELTVPPMVTGDPHVDSSLTRLPTQLADAVDTLEQSQFVRRVFGEMFVDSYVVMLRHELELFARHVTDWERERYREVM